MDPETLAVHLTTVEQSVVDAMAKGWSYQRIAIDMHVSVRTVHAHVFHVAKKLPNPDNLKPYQLVFLWAAHRVWLLEHASHARDHAA